MRRDVVGRELVVACGTLTRARLEVRQEEWTKHSRLLNEGRECVAERPAASDTAASTLREGRLATWPAIPGQAKECSRPRTTARDGFAACLSTSPRLGGV